MSSNLQAWVQARDWSCVLKHFAEVAPVTAAEFASRGLATRALRPGPEGAREALPDLLRALELQPHSPSLASNLLQGLIDAGEVAEACLRAALMVQQAPQLADLRDKQVQALMAAARWEDALLVASAGPAASHTGQRGAALREELASQWWRPQVLGDICLRLPSPGDRDFVARCFRNSEFMVRFHRFQPGDDAAIDEFIGRATTSPRRTRRLDWIAWRSDQPIGLTSLVDIDHTNRRAELQVGIPNAGMTGPAALQASLAAMQFAFDRLGVHKLISHVYGDNPISQANTLHLGLRQEGLLREHLQVDGKALDLFVNGMLVNEFHADARLQRLLRRWAVPNLLPSGHTNLNEQGSAMRENHGHEE